MPNWCHNSINISGKSEDMLNFFKKAGYRGGDLQKWVENSKLSLRSWLPMPKTFKDWDTTNSPKSRDQFSSEEQYNRYMKSWNSAQTYQMKKYGCIGWYQYNYNTLGCKQDADLELIDFDPEYVLFVCDTPWNVPREWIRTLIKENPKLLFDLEGVEPGMGFKEIISGGNGHVDADYSEEYQEEVNWNDGNN